MLNADLSTYVNAIVRNGYLPQRPIQIGIGNVEVKVPKVRGIAVATEYI
ncbi:MAG: hypothetical protein ACTS73_04145 [Arsenophonus sp. NEOnobi-MAG3]